MKHFKAIIVTVMLGLAVTLIPKASWASDVSVGVFFGIPFPVVTIAPPQIHHPGPGFFIPPPPFHHFVRAYAPPYRHNEHYGKWDNRRGDDNRRDDGRGDYGHGDGRRR